MPHYRTSHTDYLPGTAGHRLMRFESPLSHDLRQWSDAWKRGERLGTLIDHDLKFSSLFDLLPSSKVGRAITNATETGQKPLSFARLHDFLRDSATLERIGLAPGDRCAIALPEGAELAVCLLAISARCVAVPMNPWNPEGEIAADLAESGAKAMIVQVGEDFDHLRRAARSSGIAIIELIPLSEETGLFQLNGDAIRGPDVPRTYNSPGDIALMLFTSGTTGRKKLVSVRLQDLCVGACCLAAALELGPDDCGYNMMPLFHVGGIVRNLYAPLLAGSGMVYSSGFDATMFWDVLERGVGFNWYYASPTMHDEVIQEGVLRPLPRPKLRFICNAAGNLLPSTAEKLRNMFDAAILPGYGMTECMPIACPPLDYRLERRGASGRILGPEVSIRDEAFTCLPTGIPGRIFLRGAPVARSMVKDADSGEPDVPADWFDTGDIGRLDEDGFLYIVGRSKDVIKRGGETIAPAEIEEVLVAHPEVRAALAFPIPHKTLGETVGAVIVPRSGRRVDLEGLAPHLSKNLIPAKWPVVLVYMEDLPKSTVGKLLRVGLAARLGLGEVDEKSPVRSRLLTADCPPAGTNSSIPISARAVEVSPTAIEAAIRQACPTASQVVVHIDDVSGAIRAAIEAVDVDNQMLKCLLHSAAHDYLVPRSVVVLNRFPRDATAGTIDVQQVWSQLDNPGQRLSTPSDEIETFILHQWRKCLGQDRDVYLDSDFFDDLAGDSLTAVRIVADVRKQYAIALPPTAIFRHRTILALTAAVRTAIAAKATPENDEPAGNNIVPPQHEGPSNNRSTAIPTLVTQLLPITFLPPLLRVGQFVFWMFSWWYMRSELGLSGDWVLFAALAATFIVKNTLAPLAAICLKWIVVGRYRPHSAPLWSPVYLRWWLVHQICKTADLGVFALSYPLTALYYRLMGAKVGVGTRITHNADLGEFDLLTIGDHVCIEESAIVRPFVLEGGAMAFRPINIGANSTIGIRATVVPGTVLPADTDIAPLASSDDHQARNQGTRTLCRPLLFSPPTWLKGFGLLLIGAVMLVSWAPMFLVMHNFVSSMGLSSVTLSTQQAVLLHMMSPERLATFSGRLILSALASPFLYLAGVILVKWIVIGRFRAGTDVTKPWPMFERWLMWQLLPDGRFGGVGPLLGSNFAGISVIYRLLGAKIGKRIYWPGSGNVLVEYDLFSCGDDVTFGSRSTYLMTSTEGSRPIHIEAGANVADRCVLAPGVRVEKNAVLGSGTFAPAGFVAPAGSTWIGHDGQKGPIELEAATPRRAEAPTLRPYGLAMYKREADYFVWPLGMHIAFNFLWAAAAAGFRAAPMIGALFLTRTTLAQAGPDLEWASEAILLLSGFYLALYITGTIVSIAILIATKWLIIGRRVEGEHLWHRSSYCQRWKVHGVISSLTRRWAGRRDLLSFFEGSVFLVWYFRAQGARIGTNVCLYPNGADPMMEEPDFLDIGNDACIDQAVLIAHLNTRGEWIMGPIEIGQRACLRSMSRIMMRSTVGERSTLLEGTLVLAGDSSLPASTWRGWPGQAISPKAIAELSHRAEIQTQTPLRIDTVALAR